MKNLRIAPVFLLVFGISGQVNATILVEDDFNDGVIDTSKWITGGSDVTEHDGILDIQMNVTDAGGWARTVQFTPTKKFRLEVEHTMHPGGNYFFPNIYFDVEDGKGDDSYENDFSIIWLKSDYSRDYCYTPTNHNKVMIHGFTGGDAWGSNCYAVSNLNSSDYYDKKIKSVISYDATTGKIDLDVEGDGIIDFSAVAPADKRFPVRQAGIGGFGWWTGHYHQVDSFKLESLDNTNIITGTNMWLAPPSYAVQCINNTTGKKITVRNYKQPTYSCEKMGLGVAVGDNVTVAIRGNVQSKALDTSHITVNGHVTWAQPYDIQCMNNTTGQKISFSSSERNYDCEKAGLAVIGGDDVKVNIRGVADSLYSNSQNIAWNQLLTLATAGDILLFNHEHECSGESCLFDSGAYALGEPYGFNSHAALVVSKDINNQTLKVFHAKGAGYKQPLQVSTDKLSLDKLHTMYPRGSITLLRVKNVNRTTRIKAVNEGIAKYNTYSYISFSNFALGLIIPYTTYCSALVRDIWADQGIILDDKDSYDGAGIFTRFIFTPDELGLSSNLQPLVGMTF